MSLFSRPQPALLGVDISSSAVKVLELSRQGTRYRVEHYAIEALPAGVVSERNFTDIETVGEAIKRAVDRSGSKAKQAVIAVAANGAIIKTVPMPSDLSAFDLESQVQLEASNYIPFPIEEVFLDFETIGPMAGATDTNEVLLVAARQDAVNARLDALAVAGLTPEIVDVDTFAIERAVTMLGEGGAAGKGVVALVDVGATTTTLHVLLDGKIIYSREQAYGVRQLTDEIGRRTGMAQIEMQRAWRQGTLFDEATADALVPFQEGLTQQINRLLQFFHAASEHNRVDQLLLVGGGARLPSMTDMIEEQLGIPSQVFNPLANMTLGGRIQAPELGIDAASLLTVAGLALRGAR